MIASVVRLIGPLLCAAWAVMLASPASADNVEDPSAYRALVSDALDEFEAGNYAEARSLFARAHSLHPSARTLRGLGLSSFELREYRSAVEYLERALESDVHPLDPPLREVTEQVVARARGFIGRFTVHVEPAYAQLRIDGMNAEAGALELEVGSHVLDVEAPGHRPERRMLRVLGGEDEQVLVVLTPLARTIAGLGRGPAAPQPLSTGHDQSADRSGPPLYRSGWLWVGIGMVAVAVGVVLGVAGHRARGSVGEPTRTANTPAGGVLSALGDH